MTPARKPTLKAVLAPISKKDVRSAYAVQPMLGIDDSKTTVSFELQLKTMDGNRVNCTVSFYTKSGDPILERELERWLLDNKRLRGKPGQRAKVAYRVKFYARSNYRGKGFGQYILSREEDLFRRWGAKEIQVTAMDDGRWVWTRPKFGYECEDFYLLQQRYVEWQRETSAPGIIKAETASDFPKEYLLSSTVRSLNLYKELF